MKLHPIHTRDDLLALESRPYRAFMPHTWVFQALQATAARLGQRPALRYIRSANLDEAPQVWTYGELVNQIRRAAGLFQALAGRA